MIENSIFELIGTYGFPIVVTMYLLIERGKSMKELTKAVNQLILVIETFKKR